MIQATVKSAFYQTVSQNVIRHCSGRSIQIMWSRARYGTNGFNTEPAGPRVVLESVPVLARTRGSAGAWGRTDPTGTGRYGYGFYGFGLGGARALRVRNPGADMRSASAWRSPGGDRRGPALEPAGFRQAPRQWGAGPGSGGSCACTCTQSRMWHTTWYMHMRMHMAMDMRTYGCMHLGMCTACWRIRHEHRMHSCASHAHVMLVNLSRHAYACTQALSI